MQPPAQTADGGDRRSSVASTATATASFHDALEDQLTQPGSRFSFQTAADTLEEEPPPAPGANSGAVGLENRGYDSPQRAESEAEQPEERKSGKSRKQRQKRKGPGRIWRKSQPPAPSPPPPPLADDGDDGDADPAAADDDFGFRYRPAIGPPRPLLPATGQATALAASPHTTLTLEPDTLDILDTLDAPEDPIGMQGLQGVQGEQAMHYYYDNRLLLSGSIPRCRFSPGVNEDSADDPDGLTTATQATLTTASLTTAAAEGTAGAAALRTKTPPPPTPSQPPQPPPQPPPTAEFVIVGPVCCDRCRQLSLRNRLIIVATVAIVCLAAGAVAAGVVLGTSR